MFRKLSSAFLLVFALAAAAVGTHAQQKTATTVPSLTVDEIISKHLAARGGADDEKAVKSVKMSGKILVQGGALELPGTMQIKRPGMMRMDLAIQGKSIVQAFDGTTGWAVNPFEGSSEPQKASEADTRELAEDADLDGPLVDHKAKGYTIDLAGKEDFEGTPVYKLKVTAKNGDVSYFYLDAGNFLSLKEVSKRKVQGVEAEIESLLGDYKPVEGMMMPFSIENKVGGRTVAQYVIEKIEFNTTMDDANFRMPAKSAPPAATTPAKEPEKKP